jgi:transposase-like protein
MTNQVCPVCYSTNTKVRHVNGVPELCCHDCGYDSADKNQAAWMLRRKKDKREQLERGKGGR